MSKKQTSLFKYFNTPPSSKKQATTESKDTYESTTPKSSRTSKRALVVSSDSDDDVQLPIKQSAKKRTKIIDSDDEQEASTSTFDSPKPSLSKFAYVESSGQKVALDDTTLSKTREVNVPRLPHVTFNDKMKSCHESILFLQPENIRDKYGKRPSDPDYDPRTLYVPSSFLEKLTPALRQWWIMKQDHYDCVLFFKVGKFYELYHMDAIVGFEELGLTYMKGNFPHCGFPEMAYGRMASCLVEKGYKVARIEQTETPEMMQERIKTESGKKVKVVKREICQITTRATQVYNTQDSIPTQSNARYLLALCEKPTSTTSDGVKTTCTYGVCFVETSLGEFHVGQFDDDIHRSCLYLLVTHFPPALILYPKGENGPSEATRNIFNTTFLAGIKKEPLVPAKHFLTPSATIKFLLENKYFEDADGNLRWPSTLQKMLDGEGFNVTSRPEFSLALSSVGAVTWYLNYSKLDDQLLSMGNIKMYQPNISENGAIIGSNMILDAITLYHLRIVDRTGSLYDKLNYCQTAFGKRLLRMWVCSPLCNVSVIKERQEAISELMNMESNLIQAQKILKTLPDLERLLTRIHAQGNKIRSTKHPDSRAIFFEEKKYSKKKIADFCTTLQGFNRLDAILKCFDDVKSPLLRRITQLTPEGNFPLLKSTLEYFERAFDRQKAKADGRILPPRDIDEEYDEVLSAKEKLQQELEDYRREQEKFFKCKVPYFGSDRKRYQLEVPVDKAVKATREYQLEGTRKGFKRFSTSETKRMLSQMQALEEKERLIVQDVARKLFEKFSLSFEKWNQAIHCISTLDVLMALAQYSNSEATMCLPNIIEDVNEEPFIEIVEGRHPLINSSKFIPNDTSLGRNGVSQMLILTGPNMGGKSTLMRQVSLISILAQIGCYVPAEECNLTVIDRIFTRIGARDEIVQGSSTFMVELSETNAILKYATRHSLILLDELGRGTSTYDGTSIAAGVVRYIAERRYRTMFSTHYHQIMDSYREIPNVSFGHMTCLVETDDTGETNEDKVTFLYKLAPGSCPKSYGFNTARLGGLPDTVIRKGMSVSQNFETEMHNIQKYIELLKLNNVNDMRTFISNLR